jgi:acyl-coenzyme A synthetase/AMP-(fatty) acid ligase
MYNFRKSSRYQSLLKRAVSMDDPLSPHEAMEWIESEYGSFVENISGSTLHMMVFVLCLKNGYPADKEEVDEAILDFMNAY